MSRPGLAIMLRPGGLRQRQDPGDCNEEKELGEAEKVGLFPTGVNTDQPSAHVHSQECTQSLKHHSCPSRATPVVWLVHPQL